MRMKIMAKEKEIKLNILSSNDRASLEKLTGEIAKAEKTLDLLEELGLGIADPKAKLEWSKKRVSILLEKG